MPVLPSHYAMVVVKYFEYHSCFLLSFTSVSGFGEDQARDQLPSILLIIPHHGSARYFGLLDEHGERRPFSFYHLISSWSLSVRDYLGSHFNCEDTQKGSIYQGRPSRLRLWPLLSCLSFSRLLLSIYLHVSHPGPGADNTGE